MNRTDLGVMMAHQVHGIAHIRKSDGTVQPLVNHLRQVAKTASRFAAKIGLSKCGFLVGLLHDLGKYAKEFIAYITSAAGLLDQDSDDYVDAGKLKGKIDHSTS
ncbi:MAG: CRISPR-associated endonuclease Cas3'', partial [Deltaproteobacteria bacterium]|nr:CRISPR-associated endonuclease Cas3'' [Deltaproteobacteria bacterium]